MFASADVETLDDVSTKGLVAGDGSPFSSNTMQIVVANGNRKHLTGLADLGRGDVAVALCAPTVPYGKCGRQVLSNAGISVKEHSDETNAGALIGRIGSGEVDAGIAYGTDTTGDVRVKGIDIPGKVNVTAHYPIVVVNKTSHAAVAKASITFVLSLDGQRLLALHGFGPL